MRKGLKALGLVLLASMIRTDAHAVAFDFVYLTPFTNGEEPYAPFMQMIVADDLWWANETVSGSQSWLGGLSIPYRGLEFILPGADYVNVPCREDLEYVGSCSVSPSWLTLGAGLSFNLSFRDNLMLGSVEFQGLYDYLSAHSDATGIWSIGGFGTDYDGYFCGGDCTATGRWVSESGAAPVRPVPAPEPGTLALFGLGLAGLVLTRRRKAA